MFMICFYLKFILMLVFESDPSVKAGGVVAQRQGVGLQAARPWVRFPVGA